MDDERAPDHTDDPRKQGVGQEGYPETQPEEATAPDRDNDEDDEGDGEDG